MPDERAAAVARGDIFERAGYLVQPDRKLGQVLHRRPPGITTHQWSSAARTHLAFVVCDARTCAPVFAVELYDPAGRVPEAQRGDRMTSAVCEAAGLQLLRIESSALRLGSYARRVVEYVIDARAFADAARDQETPGLLSEEPQSYRDILGRLPDGRTGFVNDLGSVARAAAVDAYASRQLVDPIIRGLHVCWKNGPAEGWGWLEVREGLCIFERTRIWQHHFCGGIDPGRLAEDLAAAAIGECLKTLDTVEPVLREKDLLARDFDELRLRGDEMENGFGFDHIFFD
jgi:hypothetical protein